MYVCLNNLVARSKGKANKSTTPRTALSFQRKEEELLGSEVERQGKQVNYTQDSSFFSEKGRRAALGEI